MDNPESNSDMEYDSMVDAIFQKDKTESVDFEVAFTALLATGVFASLPTDTLQRATLVVVASSLLLLTVVRRMAIVGRFAKETYAIQKSQIPIEFASFLCIYHIINSALHYTADTLPFLNVNGLWVNSSILVLSVLCVSLHQLTFRDYFLYWGAYFYNQGHTFRNAVDNKDTSPFEDAIYSFMSTMFFKLAYQSLDGYIPEDDSVEISILNEFMTTIEENVWEDKVAMKNNLSAYTPIFIGSILMFMTPILILLYIFP